MRKIFLLLALTFSLSNLEAQRDTSFASADTVLVKGLYKNYQEFVKNAPSVIRDFSVTKFVAAENDPTVIAAVYVLPDSSDNFGEVWGFCDGTDVYVSSGTFTSRRYWKLQCKGPNPFLYYKSKTIMIIPSIAGIIATAVTAGLPASVKLMVIDKSGKVKGVNEPGTMKQLLRDDTELFKKYKAELKITDTLAKQYILDYNQWRLYSSLPPAN
jgi:hypothetical protein